jgi:hypothetical protein
MFIITNVLMKLKYEVMCDNYLTERVFIIVIMVTNRSPSCIIIICLPPSVFLLCLGERVSYVLPELTVE